MKVPDSLKIGEPAEVGLGNRITSSTSWTVTKDESVHFVSNVNGKGAHFYKRPSDSQFAYAVNTPFGELYPMQDKVILAGLQDGRPVSVIHKGDWKLHLFYEEWALDGGREKLATNHAVELYNLIDDIGERNDLSNINAAKRDELLNELLAWQTSVNAPIPTERNPDYAPGTGTTGKGRAKGKRAQSDDE